MLESDPKRQAVNTLRGYAYQIWQSLYEWISLAEEEVLYLEGAEDLDRLGPQSAQTIQVKYIRSASVTLNSEEILQSIVHFWGHKKRNRDIKIQYRFLTTAERGKEILSPFGDRKGLNFWDDCKYKDTDLGPLRGFLLTKISTPEDLKDFIEKTDDESLRSELIIPIVWDTGNPDREYIEEAIRKKLIHHGDRLSFLPSDSERSLDTLLRVTYETACKEGDRKLERSDFLRLFEQSTSINLPISSLRQGFSAISSRLQEILPTGGLEATSEIDICHQDTFPLLPEKYSGRTEIVSSLGTKLRSDKILFLQGSSGTGKSTIAALLVQHLKGRAQWINMRGKDAESINSILWKVNLGGGKFNDTLLVIDDISFREFRIYENAIIGIINIVLSANGYIIITTQEYLPDKLSHYLPRIEDLTVNAPSMTFEEIKELSELHDSPSGKQCDLWSHFILFKTGGHPQLVHSKIRNLESLGWPAPSLEALTEPDDLETIKHEVQTRLISDLPFDSARTLSYRLSILHHPFRKQHALIMGEKFPAVLNPGEAFEILVGPWVERLSSGYYIISPLLKDMAKEVWSNDEIKELHTQAAKALLAAKTLSPIEASNAILHGIIGESGEVIMPLIYFLLTNKKNVLPRLSEDLRWLTMIATIPGQKIYQKNPIISLTLRLIQFRIAAVMDKKEIAVSVAKAWEQEVEDVSIDQLKMGFRLLFLVDTVIRLEVPFPISVILSRVNELIQKLLRGADINGAPIPIFSDGKDILANITSIAIMRCQNYEDLLVLIEAINNMDESDRHPYLSLLNTKDDWSNSLVSQVYLREYKSSTPKWLDCLSVFQQTIAKALSWKATSLVASAYHMVAVILDEHLEEPDKALDILDEARKYLENDNPIIEDARAMILFRQKRDKEALEILERILPAWKTDFDPTPLFAYRRAEISAARLGDWDKATTLAQNGEKYALQLNMKTMEIGFRADQAFALWKKNERQRTIELFASAVHDFQQLPDPHNDLKTYALEKRIGHALAWLLSDIVEKHSESLAEPHAGFFSNHEVDELIKNYPLQPIEFFWQVLAEIELELKSDDKIFNYFAETYYNTEYPFIRLSLFKLYILHSLRKRELSSLVKHYSDFIKAIELSKKSVSGPKDIVKKIKDNGEAHQTDDTIDSLITLLCFASVILFREGIDMKKLLNIWKSDAETLGLINSNIVAWFAFLEVAISKGDYELTQIMSDGSRETGIRFIASILLANKKTILPQTALYSHLLLFNIASPKHSIWGGEIEAHLEQIIVPIWTDIATTKSFALLNPRINVSAILKACEDSSIGFKKVASVLLAAMNAVQLRITQEMLISLKRFVQ